MTISVTFRNADGEVWLKNYVAERLQKLKKYVDNPMEVQVVLSVEKFRNVAEVKFASDGLKINAKEEEKDMPLAIDNAIIKIERQLKKHKEKIRERKGALSRAEGERGQISNLSPTAADDQDDLPSARIVEVRNLVLKPMSLDDAILEMETTRNRFVVYRDSQRENINVIYRQEDGSFALIEATG